MEEGEEEGGRKRGEKGEKGKKKRERAGALFPSFSSLSPSSRILSAIFPFEQVSFASRNARRVTDGGKKEEEGRRERQAKRRQSSFLSFSLLSPPTPLFLFLFAFSSFPSFRKYYELPTKHERNRPQRPYFLSPPLSPFSSLLLSIFLSHVPCKSLFLGHVYTGAMQPRMSSPGTENRPVLLFPYYCRFLFKPAVATF